MPEITHPELVAALVKPPQHLMAEMTPDKMDCIHAVMGIAGEAGELLDAVKKHTLYDKPLDREHVIEELGDMEFYMEQLRQRLYITREECLEHNIRKLSKRYHKGTFSNEQAQARADKG